MDKQFLNLIVKTIKADEKDNRVIRFLGSDSTTDRDDEILTKEGWIIKNYKKNPVFLWAHRYSEPPIGRAKKVKATDKGLEFDIEFADAETYPFADTIYKLYKNGYLNAVSVGFIPDVISIERNEDTVKINKKELLELSAVPVPANPNALRLGMKSAIDDEVINEFEFAMFEEMAKGFSNKCQDCKDPEKPEDKPDDNSNDDKKDNPDDQTQSKDGIIEKAVDDMTKEITEIISKTLKKTITEILKDIEITFEPEGDPKPDPKKQDHKPDKKSVYNDILSIDALRSGKKKPNPINSKDVDKLNKIFDE
jgi:HK97 family phage prohead protease